MIYTYLYNGVTHTITLEQRPDGSYTATIGDQTYSFQANLLQHGAWLITIGGERTLVYSAAQEDRRFAWVGASWFGASHEGSGQHYELTVASPRSERRTQFAGSGDLTAQMPGQVLDVLVAEGDTVTRGQALVILEAMKMEIRVTAPQDGRIQRLLVARGDVVERGQRLLELG